MGVRVLLDGVVNHSGREFFAFRDVREKGRESSYSGWYHIQWDGNSHFNDGFVYAGWNGHQSLPNFNHQHPEVKKYLFEVARFWLADVGVDGWRLDAADAVDPSFWWEFRQACKEARPGSFLLGELVHGDYNAYVASDLLDSATNYQLYKPIWSALNDANFWELKHALDRAFHTEIGIYNQLTLVNFLSNHDVTRILSQLNDSRHIYPVLIFLMTAPGIPAIYYGDEVGLKGRKEDGDAALRSPMPLPDSDWPDQERHLFRETRRLIALRKAYPALTYGRYAALDTTGTQFSYLRDYEGQVVIVALNAENDPVPMTLHVGREGVRDGVTFYDVLNPEQGGYTATGGLLNLPEVWGNWGRVLVASR
jgi:glycosidase